jgi:hypothetical protein
VNRSRSGPDLILGRVPARLNTLHHRRQVGFERRGRRLGYSDSLPCPPAALAVRQLLRKHTLCSLNSEQKQIVAIPVDADGVAGEPQVVVPTEELVFDGIAMSEDGHIYALAIT